MRKREYARTRALAAAALLLTATATTCESGGGTEDDSRPASLARSDSAGRSTTPPRAPDGDALPASITGQELKWRPCAPSGWSCTTIEVPLDYEKPDGETLDIALNRKQATGEDRRIGSLLFNFGGPGASGVDILPQVAAEYTELGERYDLVGFDPRGTGKSSGVRCRTDEELEAAAAVDLTPDTAAEEKAYFEDAAAFGAACEKRSGRVLPHVSTTDAARDMDLMRHLLGDGKMHYFGMSYGTELGGTYAHLFPENVGRVVLDAVIDPKADTFGHALNQTKGFQRALENYLKSTGQDPETGTRKLADLLKRIDRAPLETTPRGRELNDSLALTGIVRPLYSQSGWPALTEALKQAESGDGTGLLRMADEYNDRDASGHYGTQSHAQRAISCADDEQRPTSEKAKARLPEFRALSPVFGEFLGWDTAGWCADWPVPGEHTDPEVSAKNADPILVVGTTGDPATPYEGAERMADELGEGVGVLLTNKGEGHGAYGNGACVTDTVDAYLLDGTVPQDGKTCS